MLDGGVTSVRDVGGPGLRFAPVDRRGSRMRSPRIFGAGRILSTTGGHGDLHSTPPRRRASACRAAPTGLSQLCDGVPEVLKAVRTNLRARTPS